MEYRILGELEVENDGRAVELGGPRQRALLTNLLLHASEVVSADRLIEDLYGANPPATAAKTLQAHISRLRKALGAGWPLRTRGGGYVLELSAGELDAERFSTLLEEGRQSLAEGEAEQAVATLERALALWRGPPLADVVYAEFAQGEVARLDELHLTAVEELIDARIALGRHVEAVSDLERLVAAHPHRERLRASLLLALYRSGRQAEALDAYQRARTILVEELGIEPSRSLRALHHAILTQDPVLDLPVSDPPHPTATVAPAASHPVVETVVRDARKTVTALFVRIGVTAAGGGPLDPEALRRVTGRAFEAVENAADGHGGTIEAVSGDAITAVFGLPLVHEDDALRAMRAADVARTTLFELASTLGAERALQLDSQIGISTGEIVTGGIDAIQARATGEPLTISQRLGDNAAPGEILIDSATRAVLRDAVTVEPARGGWRVLDAAAVAPGRVGRFDSPMVGRERERRRLQDAFDQAVSDRSCQLFTVLGVAGVGKSRLVHEFLQGLGRGTLVASGRCLPYGEGITYWPLLEAVKSAVGLDDSSSPDDARATLARVLDGEQGGEASAQRVAEMIGIADAIGGAERFSSAVTLFEVLARAHSLVIVFDDIHWAEPTFLDLIEHLAESARDAPILLVCLGRPELLEARPGWAGGKLNATTALLEPLSEDECGLLIGNLLGRTGLVEEVETRIAEAAGGNPLFVEETLLMLIDDGLLVSDDGHWAATGDIGAVRVPPTIQALLAARLDRLDENERSVVERAAVVGKVFYEAAVADLGDGGSRPVAESLETLARKQLIRPDRPSLGGRTFRFRHLLIRDSAYASIPKERRAHLHERFGRWLERSAGDRGVEYEEVVGYHLEQAYRYRAELGTIDEATRGIAHEAAERLGAAGRRAFSRSDAPAAVNLISRAVALLPADDPLRVDLIPNVRAVQGMTDLAWADRALTEAVEAAATTGNRRLAASALVQRGFFRLFTEPELTPDELIEVAERAVIVFDDLGDELGLARAWRLVAQSHYLGRRLASCAEASERALAHARRVEDRFEEREIVEWLVIALLLGPAQVSEAARRCERLLQETVDNPLLQAEILGGLAALMAMLGRADRADELSARSKATMGAHGESIWIVSFWLAFVHLWRGDPSGAECELRPAYDTLKRIGERSHFSSIAHELSNAVLLQGRYDEAEQLTRECEESSRPNDVHSQILWRSTRAKVLAHKGDLRAAERLARVAVAFAAESDFYPAHADALMDLGHVLELGGKSDAAAHAVQEAIRFYRLKGNLAQLERARAVLKELRT